MYVNDILYNYVYVYDDGKLFFVMSNVEIV